MGTNKALIAVLSVIAFVAVVMAISTIYNQASFLAQGEAEFEEYERVYIAEIRIKAVR